jgi:hypothetical protein
MAVEIVAQAVDLDMSPTGRTDGGYYLNQVPRRIMKPCVARGKII